MDRFGVILSTTCLVPRELALGRKADGWSLMGFSQAYWLFKWKHLAGISSYCLASSTLVTNSAFFQCLIIPSCKPQVFRKELRPERMQFHLLGFPWWSSG